MSNVDKRNDRTRLLSPRDDPELNPCLDESNKSMKCLSENQTARERCEVYFENFRNCNKFWNKIRTERKRQGIEPCLPSSEERLEILRKHGFQ